MKKFLKPTPIKILVFLSPIIFQMVFWLVVVIPRGFNLQNILSALGIVWQTLSFPGLILCGFIPSCTELRGDVIWTNPYLFYLSSFVAAGLWYLISVGIGLITPFYSRLSELFASRLRINQLFILPVVLLLVVFIFYLIAYFANRAFWYKSTGGKNINVEKWECINGFFSVYLKNLGFEKVAYDEIQIYVDNSPLVCNWKGNLSVGTTSICSSREALGPGPREHLPDWHDIEVKIPGSSITTSVNCQ